MRSALVTGAFGFVGRHVSRRLARRGWQVTGIDIQGEADGLAQWGISAWRGGAVEPGLLDTLEKAPDVIVHCAAPASVGNSLAAPYDAFLGTLAGTAAVLDYMRRRAPEARHIYMSSAAVYGNATVQPIAENAMLAPVSPYGAFKRQAEMLCEVYARFFGVRSIPVRPFSIYGAGLRKQLLWDACRKFASAEPAFGGTGAEVRDWLHVEDLAALIVILAESDDAGRDAINAGSGQGTAIRDVIALVAAAFAAEMPPHFSGTSRSGDPPAYIAEISRARGLGWTPKIALADGVADYVRWFKTA